MSDDNRRGGFESLEGFFKNTAPWSYIVLGLIGWGLIMGLFFYSKSKNSTPAAAGNVKTANSNKTSASPSPSALTVTRPLNGETLTERETTEGLHEFVIENNGDSDAIVKLIDAKTQKTYRHSYVHAKRALELKNIRDGIFMIKFSIGSDYSPETKLFTKQQVYLLSSANAEFLSSKRGDYIYGVNRKVVLFPEKGGNVRVHEITAEDFADKEDSSNQ